VHTRTVSASEVRIPELAAGELIIIERYGKPYAALIDTESLQLFQRLLAMFGEHRPAELMLSETALAVHRASEAGED
jgi:hypothetical protein